jgi:hypothetical protein
MMKKNLMPSLYRLLKALASNGLNHKPYGIFISHAWNYHSDYLRMIEILYTLNGFEWENCSNYQYGIAPNEIDFFHAHLPSLLRQQIYKSHCVLIMTDIYLENKYWVQKEIDIARELNKPVIAIKSKFLSLIPEKIKESSLEVVDWNPEVIFSAIKKHVNCD